MHFILDMYWQFVLAICCAGPLLSLRNRVERPQRERVGAP